MSVNRCELCYELIVNPCDTFYRFPTGLPNDAITMVLEDIHGNIYTQDGTPDVVTTDWTITTGDFPDGMFNQWSGSYNIHFIDAGHDINERAITLTINEEQYECVIMKFKIITDVS